MTKRERLQDEEILASILAAAGGAVARRVEPTWESATAFDSGHEHGPACAVGAAILYRFGETRGDLSTFARLYEVTENYAAGVSDGFEDNLGTAHHLYGNTELMRSRADYQRGYAVGASVRDALGFE